MTTQNKHKVNVNISFLFLLIVTFLLNTSADIGGAQKKTYYTIPSSISEPILLGKHWLIIEDPSPKEFLKEIPDSLWIISDTIKSPDKFHAGNWLNKTYLLFPDSLNPNIVIGFFPKRFVSAYEIYWDRKLIARNGVIGTNKEEEKPGMFNFDCPLPSNLLSPGLHELIIRCSNYNIQSPWKWYLGSISLCSYVKELKKETQDTFWSFFQIGLLFIVFLLNLFLFIARKGRKEHALFGLICFFMIVGILIEDLPMLFELPTTIVNWLIHYHILFNFMECILLPAFLFYFFSVPKKWLLVLIILINLSITLFFYSQITILFLVTAIIDIVLITIITVWALAKRREGSIIIMCGIVLQAIFYFTNIAQVGLIVIMIVCITLSLARQYAAKEKSERDAQLRSTRLENELLRKNINPHFILNTITSIIVWLRRDSASAIKLMEALAEEFRLITQISALKLIPIQQEIELCLTHLKIMNYRKGAEFKLITLDINDNENVPPMIFHTLVENGLTHGYENINKGVFSIQRQQLLNGVKYIVSNDGKPSASVKRVSTGLGLKYIEARLEESFSNKWKLTSFGLEDSWQVEIEIYNLSN